MSLDWTNDPVAYTPTTMPAWGGGVNGDIVLHGTKNLGGGETRTIWARLSWSGESDHPGDTVIFSEVEAVWDALVTAGYTVTGGGVTTKDPVGYGFEKA